MRASSHGRASWDSTLVSVSKCVLMRTKVSLYHRRYMPQTQLEVRNEYAIRTGLQKLAGGRRVGEGICEQDCLGPD